MSSTGTMKRSKEEKKRPEDEDRSRTSEISNPSGGSRSVTREMIDRSRHTLLPSEHTAAAAQRAQARSDTRREEPKEAPTTSHRPPTRADPGWPLPPSTASHKPPIRADSGWPFPPSAPQDDPGVGSSRPIPRQEIPLEQHSESELDEGPPVPEKPHGSQLPQPEFEDPLMKKWMEAQKVTVIPGIAGNFNQGGSFFDRDEDHEGIRGWYKRTKEKRETEAKAQAIAKKAKKRAKLMSKAKWREEEEGKDEDQEKDPKGKGKARKR